MEVTHTMNQPKFSDCLYFASARLNRYIAKIGDTKFKQIGLSSSSAFVLMCIADNPAINPSEIADELYLDRSTITRFLDKLEVQGFITRVSDGRSVKINVTPMGHKLIPAIANVWDDLNQTYADLLGADTEKNFRATLNQHFANLTN